jgi:Icc-related predicted phosphoesterase
MNKKTKIFAVGDLHGDTALAKKLALKAQKENVDLILLTGDLTWFEQSLEGLVGPFVKIKKPVLMIPGNHESLSSIYFLSERYFPNAKNLHGSFFIREDLGIFGAGGTTQVGPNSLFSENQMFSLLKKGFEEVKNSPKKLMVTHEHPSGSKSTFSGQIAGSKGIAKAIKKFQPDLHIHSHVHEAEGFKEKIGKTKIINVGKKGRIINI